MTKQTTKQRREQRQLDEHATNERRDHSIECGKCGEEFHAVEPKSYKHDHAICITCVNTFVNELKASKE